MNPELKMVPFGVFEPTTNHLSIVFSTSAETSDFVVDCLELWWGENEERHANIRKLVINLDNGPHVNSHRTQFIKRMIEFADKTGLKIQLVHDGGNSSEDGYRSNSSNYLPDVGKSGVFRISPIFWVDINGQ